MPRPSISVVVPVYRSSRSLPELIDRLFCVLEPMERPYELVLVDDCSPDDSWAVLEHERNRRGSRLKIASLTRNRGQHNAVLCGFSIASGDVVVTMDDDLQNPPEELPRLVSAIDEGFDLSIASYESKQHTSARNTGGQLVDGLIRRMFDLPSTFAMTSFRAAGGELVAKAQSMTGVYPYVTCMLLTYSARPTNVAVRHDPRPYGSSNYTLSRSLSLAANLLFSYSTAPVRGVALFGLVGVAAAVVAGLVTLIIALTSSTVPGWASTLVVVTGSNAITLTCLTILAVYVGRVNRSLSGAQQKFTIRELRD